MHKAVHGFMISFISGKYHFNFFKKLDIFSLEQLYRFIFLMAVYENSSFSTSMPALSMHNKWPGQDLSYFNTGTWCYKIPSQCCFIFTCCVFIFSPLKILPNFLLQSSLIYELFINVLFCPNIWRFCRNLSVIDF